MADTSKVVAGVFIALTLLLSGVYVLEDKNKTYYCESSDLVGYCEKLSSGIGTRCYYNTTSYKICSEGWKKIDGFLEQQNINQSDGLCYTKDNYTYCCESSQLAKGACDFIVRR